jgi:hypothetical protein
MNLDTAIYKFRLILVHFSKDGFEEILSKFKGCLEDHVEGLPAVIGIAGIFEKGGCIEDLVEQKSDISFTNKFISQDFLL